MLTALLWCDKMYKNISKKLLHLTIEFFGDFLLYENPLTFAHTHAIISKVRSEGELFVETTAG